MNDDTKMRAVLLLVIIGTLALTMGCSTTPLTEDQLYESENRELLRLEKFERDRQSCELAGGMIQITRKEWAPRYCAYRACPPGRSDRVECVRR